MDTQYFKQKLLDKQEDLLKTLPKFDAEARESQVAEVQDETDQVTSTEAKSIEFEESTSAFHTLQLVEQALERIDDGTYGFCLDCDKAIPAARLEALPWAQYCIEDQEKHDEELLAGTGLDQDEIERNF